MNKQQKIQKICLLVFLRVRVKVGSVYSSNKYSDVQQHKITFLSFTELRLKSWSMEKLYRIAYMFCCVNTFFSWCHLVIYLFIYHTKCGHITQRMDDFICLALFNLLCTHKQKQKCAHTHARARNGVNVSQLMVTYRIQGNIECCWYLHDELAMESNGIW